ncbi:MAG: OmpA family protein [Alphaproteobacteria bacterium]|nr:OmpA family protein [Alphaproteobacteria bacterium]
MRIRYGLMAAPALLALSGAAVAEEGFYVGFGAGANAPISGDIDGAGIGASADYGLGPVIGGSIGYGFASGLRTEIELLRRANDVDAINGALATGDVDTWSLMGNVLYDFDVNWGFTPYLGVGLGLARENFEGVGPVGGSTIDDEDTVIALQGIIGGSVPLDDNFDIFADYRYYATRDADLNTLAGAAVDAQCDTHTVLLGVRFRFGAPPPPPPPPEPEPQAAAAPEPAPEPEPEPAPEPAPEVVRNYIVFFDWDRYDLTTEALAILRDAAANYQSAELTRIMATGHADRSGPDAYNEALSVRRAEAVRDELVRLGVPADAIAIAARGEREPLVPTEDGVREPQNRRVKIVLE